MKIRNMFNIFFGNRDIVCAFLFITIFLFPYSYSFSEQNDPLMVDFSPLKSYYGINEPILFNIKGNKPFFLYLLNINQKENYAVMLIPSSNHEGNMYKQGHWFVAPNQDVEFFSDSPGTEEILMLATTRYIEVSEDLFKKTKGFSTAPYSAAVDLIKIANTQPGEKVIKRLAVHISKDTYTETKKEKQLPSAITFISADQQAYKVEERMNFVLGADNPGWVHLYLRRPDGDVTLLKKQQISGTNIYNYTKSADFLSGEYAMIAIFSNIENPGFSEKLASDIFEGNKNINLSYRIFKYNVYD